ncbi:MAG: entericidin A/B family lipoprotein [Gallionellaceae bacterium]|nr:entericidin A/B family lipoprotein [Gallionellaceae bacterium]
MKKVLALLMALGVLAGCNTMEGLGKDIKEGGQKLEKAATK